MLNLVDHSIMISFNAVFFWYEDMFDFDVKNCGIGKIPNKFNILFVKLAQRLFLREVQSVFIVFC